MKKASKKAFPWKGILDFLAEVGAERDIDAFCYKALVGLETLVGADGAVLQITGPERTILPSSRVHNLPEKSLQEYRSHYYLADPVRSSVPQGITVMTANWEDFNENEIIVDFLRKNGIRSSGGLLLYDYRGAMYALLNLHKSSRRGFGEREDAVMRAVAPHLNNLLADMTMPSPLGVEAVTSLEVGGDHRILSRREAEIVGYICRRFSVNQIAAATGTSPRTVERHIENIYDKLGINRKKDLLTLLMKGKTSV